MSESAQNEILSKCEKQLESYREHEKLESVVDFQIETLISSDASNQLKSQYFKLLGSYLNNTQLEQARKQLMQGTFAKT